MTRNADGDPVGIGNSIDEGDDDDDDDDDDDEGDDDDDDASVDAARISLPVRNWRTICPDQATKPSSSVVSRSGLERSDARHDAAASRVAP